MSTNIEWTRSADGSKGFTWNPTVGCWPVSPGCLHCYAATMTKRLAAMGQQDYAGLMNDRGDHFNGLMRELPHKLSIPLRRKKPTMWFVNSMSDLFDEQISDEFIDRVFAVMNATTWRLPIPDDLDVKPWHTYQVLTKRPERMLDYMRSRSGQYPSGDHPLFRVRGEVFRGHGNDLMNAGAVLQWPPANVWLGASAENQEQATIRHRSLVDTPAAVRFWSVEPLLGPIEALPLKGIDWVIVGGESGSGCRPCGLHWIRSIVRQCKSAGVSCFVKQLGGNPVFSDDHDPAVKQSRLAVRDRKGGDMAEWPDELKVRQFPREVVAT